MGTKQRIGNKVITTIEESATIEYAAVLAGCAVEPDDCSEAPWESCDGWEHHLEHCPDEMDTDLCNAVIRRNRDYRRQLIVMDYPVEDCIWRTDGASRQTIAEMKSCAKRRFISQLKTWYEDGWQWYGAVCQFTTDDGKEYSSSCWGIDDYDYAEEMAQSDCISEVIYSLEKDGYIVVGVPEPSDNREARRQVKIDRIRLDLNSQNWKED